MFSPFLPQLRIDRLFRTGPIQPLLFLPGTTKRDRPAGIPNQAIRKLWGAEKLRNCGELSKLSVHILLKIARSRCMPCIEKENIGYEQG
jgi:hypothetical protein